MYKYCYLDLETYSAVDLKKAGAFAYAESAEVLLVVTAFDNEPVVVHEPHKNELAGIINDVLAKAERVVIHNAAFDLAVLAANGCGIPVERVEDTMAQALAHALPGKLSDVCRVLGLQEQKADGDKLIHRFSKPNKKGRCTAQTHPTEWQAFKDYAKQDVVAMRELHAALPQWNSTPGERKVWLLDADINRRGFLVDRELAEKAVELVDSTKHDLKTQTQNMTNGEVESSTQRDKWLEFILRTHGFRLSDARKNTLEAALSDDNVSEEVKELLRVRLSSANAAASKYKSLLASVCKDGRLRGTLQYCGASRTGRWAGRKFQPQNLFRPKSKPHEIETHIQMIKLGLAKDLLSDPILAAAEAVRGVIIPPAGKSLYVSDLANIEGRVAAWVAGEDWKLEAFRAYDNKTGPDLYRLAFSRAFRREVASVTKNERQIGKVMELMLQYAGGVGAFITGAAVYRIDLSDMAKNVLDSLPLWAVEDATAFHAVAKTKNKTFSLTPDEFIACDALKRLWRVEHPKEVETWAGLEAAWRNAAIGCPITVGRVKLIREDGWLRIVLSSGRSLCYRNPGVDSQGMYYEGVSPYSRKWGRVNTYGGKVFENICQAIARDVMADGMLAATAQGYEIVLTVHDEILAYGDKGRVDLPAIMSAGTDCTAGLPLAADGFETNRYHKRD